MTTQTKSLSADPSGKRENEYLFMTKEELSREEVVRRCPCRISRESRDPVGETGSMLDGAVQDNVRASGVNR